MCSEIVWTLFLQNINVIDRIYEQSIQRALWYHKQAYFSRIALLKQDRSRIELATIIKRYFSVNPYFGIFVSANSSLQN